MKVWVTSQAARNIADIVRYLRERNPAASDKIRAAILGATRTIGMFPQVGRAQRTPGVRKLISEDTPT